MLLAFRGVKKWVTFGEFLKFFFLVEGMYVIAMVCQGVFFHMKVMDCDFLWCWKYLGEILGVRGGMWR